MRAGSLKTLIIGHFSKPDLVLRVLDELPHCTHLSELVLVLSESDKVRLVTFACSINSISWGCVHVVLPRRLLQRLIIAESWCWRCSLLDITQVDMYIEVYPGTSLFVASPEEYVYVWEMHTHSRVYFTMMYKWYVLCVT